MIKEENYGVSDTVTVKRVLEDIGSHAFVLPAIQREFVWKDDQICRLFDSLMRGYPIGSFLFWKVERENTRQFYGFVRDYHQKDNPHCPRLDLTGDREVIVVLDGQQRLTTIRRPERRRVRRGTVAFGKRMILDG